jgi:hypothetical protein
MRCGPPLFCNSIHPARAVPKFTLPAIGKRPLSSGRGALLAWEVIRHATAKVNLIESKKRGPGFSFHTKKPCHSQAMYKQAEYRAMNKVLLLGFLAILQARAHLGASLAHPLRPGAGCLRGSRMFNVGTLTSLTAAAKNLP